MVDFSKKLKNKQKEIHTNPIDIYESLDRQTEKVGPLRRSQKRVLTDWYDHRLSNKDIILKLNTGAGKTLVGLLMLESRRRLREKNNYGIEMFLCNDSNLIDQTINQAKLFGIEPTKINNNNEIPDEVINGEKILVTSVQKVFNGRSIFQRPDSPEVDTMVIDDAHASAEIIKQSSTLTIEKSTDNQLYTDIFNLVSEGLRQQGEGRFDDLTNYNEKSGAIEPFLPVPYWTWIDKSETITKLISQRADNSSNIKFVWPLIRDLLPLCSCIISSKSIEITPIKYPIDFYTTFTNARQRIFMSATTASDSVLINDLDINKKAVEKPLFDPEEKWSGEKMVILPSVISDNLDRSNIVKLFGSKDCSKFGITAITPGYYRTHDWEKYGSIIGRSETLPAKLAEFRQGDFNHPLVLVNRYDGIDLPDNQTRVLIIDSLPNSSSLYDKYIDNVIPDASETILRKAQKIEQGMGRSVRADTDYSVILLIGTNLVKFVRNPKNQKYFSSQTLQQIQIGIDISRDAHNETLASNESVKNSASAIKSLLDLIAQSLNRNSDWKEYYQEQMEAIDYSPNSNDNLQMIVSRSEIIQKATDKLSDPDKLKDSVQAFIDKYKLTDEEKGWYFQLLAHIMYLRSSKTKAKKLQMIAYYKNKRLLLPQNENPVKKIGLKIASKRIENVMEQIRSYNTFENFFNTVEDISNNLSFGTRREDFESSIDELGKILGFDTDRPDEYYKKGPDNLWAVNDNLYFVIESKSEVQQSRDKIYKTETGQMNNSIAWFENHYPNSKFQALLVIPTLYTDKAGGFNADVKIVRQGSLRKLSKNIISFAKEFEHLDFNSLSANQVIEFINNNHLQVNTFVRNYSEKPK